MGESLQLHSQALVGYEDDIEASSNVSTPSMISQGAEDNDDSIYWFLFCIVRFHYYLLELEVYDVLGFGFWALWKRPGVFGWKLSHLFCIQRSYLHFFGGLGNETGLGGHYWGLLISYIIALRPLISHTYIGWPSYVISALLFASVRIFILMASPLRHFDFRYLVRYIYFSYLICMFASFLRLTRPLYSASGYQEQHWWEIGCGKIAVKLVVLLKGISVQIVNFLPRIVNFKPALPFNDIRDKYAVRECRQVQMMIFLVF